MPYNQNFDSNIVVFDSICKPIRHFGDLFLQVVDKGAGKMLKCIMSIYVFHKYIKAHARAQNENT